MENQQVNQEAKPVADMVSAIRQEAVTNEVFGAICYNFALRRRTKHTLTLRGLKARMEAYGADFKKQDYEHALIFLSSLGLGSLKRDNQGYITALTNIKVTLQSIGQASGLRVKELVPRKQKNTFKNLTPKQDDQHKRIPLPKKSYQVHLTIMVDGNPVSIPGLELAPEELGQFLIEFSHMTKKVSKV